MKQVTEYAGVPIEQVLKDAAHRNHINEYSYLLFLFDAGDDKPFSKMMISAKGDDAANQRGADIIAAYAKKGYNWDFAYVPFPEKYCTVYS